MVVQKQTKHCLYFPLLCALECTFYGDRMEGQLSLSFPEEKGSFPHCECVCGGGASFLLLSVEVTVTTKEEEVSMDGLEEMDMERERRGVSCCTIQNGSRRIRGKKS